MHYSSLSIQEIGSSRLLVYKDDVSKLNFQFKMPNLLPIVRTVFMEAPLCYFDISSKISLSELQRFTLDKFDLLKLLKIGTEVALFCMKQGVGLEEVLFDPEYVFVDAQFNGYFIPLKVRGAALPEVRSFLKNMLTNSITDPKYTDNFVQRLLNCINSENFALEDLLLLTEDLLAAKTVSLPENMHMIIEPQVSEVAVKRAADDERLANFLSEHLESNRGFAPPPPAYPEQPTIYPSTINSGFAPNLSNLGPNGQGQAPASMPQQQQMRAPEPPNYTANSPHYGATMSTPQVQEPPMPSYSYAPSSPPPQPVQKMEPLLNAALYSAEAPKVPIALQTTLFRVGRNPELVEYVINSPYIGRVHAHIENDNGQYYLIDDKSTNGTFLNTYRLPPEQKVPLKNGDIVRFAKHAFQFVQE